MNALLAFFAYFGSATILFTIFTLLYWKVTPHDEVKLIKENNPAAAIAFGGAVLGFALPISSAIESSVSLIDMAIWASVAGIVQICTFLGFRVFYPKISQRIEDGELAAAIKLASVAVAIGMINASSMTY